MTTGQPAADASPRDLVPGRGYSPPAEARWGLLDAMLGLLLFIVAAVLASLFVLWGPELDPDATQFVVALVGYGALAGVVVWASRRRGQRSLKRDFWLALRPVDLAIGLGIGLLAKVLTVVFGILAVLVTGRPAEQPSNLLLNLDPLWLVLNGVVIVVIVAPFVEELFMRGLLLHAIRNAVLRYRGRPQPAPAGVQAAAIVSALLISSAVFMLLHLAQSTDLTLLITLGLGTFTLGLLNAGIALATGRLGAAIVSHAVYNGISVIALVAIGGAA